jgi:hypothetical protein
MKPIILSEAEAKAFIARKVKSYSGVGDLVD